MRRIILLALVAALMAAMMVVGTGTAFAVEQDSSPVPLYLCTGGDDYDTYVFVPESDVKKVIERYWEKERGYTCSPIPYDW